MVLNFYKRIVLIKIIKVNNWMEKVQMGNANWKRNKSSYLIISLNLI